MANRARPHGKSVPTYREEASLLKQGFSLIAGLDEVGRGPLAGPVVAGVVIFPPNPQGSWTQLIRDSKQLSTQQRLRLMPHLKENALAIETGSTSSEEIDKIGIVAATRLAMKRALDLMLITPEYLLLDAFPLPDISIPQKPIIRGDASCLSIAAASVVAKVARDQMMIDYDTVYPGYGFAQHKGYGTNDHINRIQTFGPSPIHRYSFAPVSDLRVIEDC